MSPLTALHLDIETSELEAQSRSLSETSTTIHNRQIQTGTKQLLESSLKIQKIIKLARNQIKINFEKEIFSIRVAIQEIAIVNNQRLRHGRIHIKITISHTIFIHNYRSLFIHIATNLISNAIDTCIEKTKLESNKHYAPEISIGCTSTNEYLQIKIKDNGTGISKETEKNMFNPFHTTKGENGCGIGLAASKHIAEKYFGGDIRYISLVKKRYLRSQNSLLSKNIKRSVSEPVSEFSIYIPLDK